MKRSPHAIEDWAKEVASIKKEEMTTDEMRLFITCYTREEDMNKDPELMKLLESNDNYASILWNRIKACHTFEISPALCLYLGNIIENFGISTMIANYLQFVAHKNGLKKIGMNDFGMKAFPHGYPSKENWHKLWNMQKADDGGNILDDVSCGESIRII